LMLLSIFSFNNYLSLMWYFLIILIQRTKQCLLFPYTTLFRSRVKVRPYGWSKSKLVINYSYKSFKERERTLWKYQKLKSNYIKRSEEHTSELQSRFDIVCRLLLEKKKYH